MLSALSFGFEMTLPVVEPGTADSSTVAVEPVVVGLSVETSGGLVVSELVDPVGTTVVIVVLPVFVVTLLVVSVVYWQSGPAYSYWLVLVLLEH